MDGWMDGWPGKGVGGLLFVDVCLLLLSLLFFFSLLLLLFVFSFWSADEVLLLFVVCLFVCFFCGVWFCFTPICAVVTCMTCIWG